MTHELDVDPASAGTRVDVFLSGRLSDVTRARIQKLVASGHVTVDGQRVKASHRLQEGESVRVHIPPPEPVHLEPDPDIPIEIVYSDADLVVVNKPAGLPVHPGPGHPDKTLVHALLAQVGDLSGIGGQLRPGIVHRIDKDTSGLLVVAKSDRAHQALARQFKEHTVERSYLALVRGEVTSAGTVDAPVGRDPRHRKRFAVVEAGRGKRAVTHYAVVERLGPFTLLECRLETGRTHQIRVHMAHQRWPLVGDSLYSRKKHASAERQMLHAATLGFVHPVSGESMRFVSEPPGDMLGVLESLRAEYGEEHE